jgi:hypothetical protein
MKPYLMSNFPSVRPSLNLQFDSQPTPADMTSHLASVGATFSRASIGTYVDANGLIQEATAGQARPNYSTAGVHEGLLIEEARTNLLLSSEDLDDSTRWNFDRVTITEEAIINPKGTASAFKMAETTDTGGHNTIILNSYFPTIVSGTKYTQSYYVKKGDGATAPNIIQIASGGFISSEYQNFNISTGSLLTGNGDDATIEDVGNGWYRISMTATGSGNGGSAFILAFTNNADSGRLPSYTGVATSDIYIWGAQMEEGSFPTSYIPTSGTTATRSADVCYIDGTAFSDFYNEDEGTIFVNAMCEADSGASRFMYSFNNTISSERVVGLIGTSDAILELVVDNGVVKAQFTSPTLTLGSFFKNGFRYKTNSFNQVTNGTASTPDTSGSVPTPTQLNIASSRTPSDFFNGYIKKFIYFPRALSDNELIKLTQ